MGARGELYTTQVTLDNRSYFFNVKENRNGDIFLQVVESKSRNGEDFDRHAIVVFADDMQKFFNLNQVATEISSALIGSIAILMCVPITAIICAYLIKQQKQNEKFDFDEINIKD